MNLFFNTTNEKDNLPEYISKAKTQNDRVMDILKDYGSHATPFEVLAFYKKRFTDVPITSIRRALTTLTKEGKLEMVDVKKQGIYGRSNLQWRIKI